MPSYPGGPHEFFKMILKNYSISKEEWQWHINVVFIVDTDGSVLGLRIDNKTEKNYSEAERRILEVLKKSPRWIPGKLNGKKVPVRVTFPIRLHPNN
jgi:protein TonB